MPRSAAPGGLVIRAATRDDLGEVVSAMGQREFFTDRIGRSRQGAGVLLAAWIDGVVVGDVYLYCEAHEEPELRRELPGVPVLNHLEVTARWQRRGIGTALVHACEEAARDRGYDVLLLGVGVDNPDAKRLYARLGYRDWGKGSIVTRWTEPDGHGGIRRVSLDMDVMTRSLSAPPIEAWVPWHPEEMARRLAGVARPWHVAGGWALELWRADRGLAALRDHGDLEIAIPRGAYADIAAALAELDPYAARAGAVWPLRDGRPPPHVRQVWFADSAGYRSDTFLESGGDRTWIFKRDERIRRPMRQAVARSKNGIPYLRPECVLLYKAGNPRPKDEADFAAIMPDLDDGARRWLAAALRTAYPAHRWLIEIRASPGNGGGSPGNGGGSPGNGGGSPGNGGGSPDNGGGSPGDGGAPPVDAGRLSGVERGQLPRARER